MFPGTLSRPSAGVAVAVAAALLSIVAGAPNPPAQASRLAASWGGGQTSVWVQNLDPRNAAVVIARFYTVPGDPPEPPVVVERRNVPPWGVTVFNSPLAEGVPGAAGNLDKYALIIESDRHVAAINVTDEPFNGSAVAYNDAPISQDVVVPLAVSNFTKQEGGTEVSSMVSVESAHPSADLRATFFSRLWSHDIINGKRIYKSQSTPPVSLTSAGRGEGGTWPLDMENDFAQGPKPERYEGSVGWLLLHAPDGNQVASQSFASLQMMNRSPEGFNSFAVSSFPGVPLDQSSNRLFVPLFRSQFFGITGISVVNPDPVNAVRLRATYYVSELSGRECVTQAGGAVAHLSDDGGEWITIGPRDNAVLYQIGRDSPATTPRIQAPGSSGDPRLFPRCFGSAVLQVDPASSGKVVAMVNDFFVDPKQRVATADAYQAMRFEDSSATVAVPMVLHDQTPVAGAIYPSSATGIQIMNVDETPADVSITFVRPEGAFGANTTVATRSMRIERNRAATIYTGALPELAGQRGFKGSAVIRSAGGQRLLATVTVVRGGKDSMTYNAFKAEFGAPDGALTAVQR